MPHTAEYRRILHRMGYYNYQNGLIYRHLNQEGGWDHHLARCREYILRSVEHFQPESVTVLGSGWLLDLPLAEILEKTNKIRLVDIVHPPDVLSQAGAIRNVELKEEDVTGGLIREVWSKTSKYSFLRRMKDISEINVPLYSPEYDPGLVISLNILTQLENLPVEYIKKKSRLADDELLTFRKQVQQKHVEFLSNHMAILISDVEEIKTTKDGASIVSPTLMTNLTDGSSREEWTWDFDLRGSDYYNSTSVMKVIALTFNNEQRRA